MRTINAILVSVHGSCPMGHLDLYKDFTTYHRLFSNRSRRHYTMHLLTEREGRLGKHSIRACLCRGYYHDREPNIFPSASPKLSQFYHMYCTFDLYSCPLAHLILQGPTQGRTTSTSSARTIAYGPCTKIFVIKVIF